MAKALDGPAVKSWLQSEWQNPEKRSANWVCSVHTLHMTPSPARRTRAQQTMRRRQGSLEG